MFGIFISLLLIIFTLLTWFVKFLYLVVFLCSNTFNFLNFYTNSKSYNEPVICFIGFSILYFSLNDYYFIKSKVYSITPIDLGLILLIL